MELTQILQKALEIGGSDIFLIPGSAATAKVKGHLVQLTEEKLLPADTADMIREAYGMAGDHSDELLHRDGDDDFSFSFNRQARFRCNAYKQRGTLAATCRVVTFGLPDPDALHIPPMVIDLWRVLPQRHGARHRPGGQRQEHDARLHGGPHQLQSAMVHIITIEDPIEYLHAHKRALVSQREVAQRCKHRLQRALRAAMREAPDVIMLGEMRDYETVQTALTAAETGHLLLSSLHTVGAAKTIDRIIDTFPANQQQQVRVQLSMVLRAVVSQRLVPTRGRHAGARVRGDDDQPRHSEHDSRWKNFPDRQRDLWRCGVSGDAFHG